MTTKTRLNCTATYDGTLRVWHGTCRQFPDIVYTSKGKEGALSGARRMAKRRMSPQPKPPVASPATAPLLNRVVVVLDRSSSMNAIRQATVDAVNRTLRDVRENAARTGQETTLGLVTFGTDVRFDRFNEPIAGVRDITSHEYRPEGMTALLDAVGAAAERLQDLPGADDPTTSMLVIVITDGEENASKRWDRASLASLMFRKNATDRWTFAFQVPPGSAQRLSQQWGIPAGNITEWEATAAGMAQAAQVNSLSIQSYYAARSVGRSSVRDFYTTDLSTLKASTVSRALADIRSQVRSWPVTKEAEVRPFVEARLGGPMLKGGAFYELTKAEKAVQDYKRLLIVHRTDGRVYAGADARHLLGLPERGTISVRPGNHGEWRVFVQSTSTNRKLVRGTDVVYWAAAGVPYTEGPSARSQPSQRARRK